MLISNNLPVRKSYFDSNIIARILQRFFLQIILKRTSTEAHVYMSHLDAKVKHSDASNVIYHKFSHGAVYYTLNGEDVNVMLELNIFGAGLEKLTNANRFVSTVNDRLLPVKLTEIADWTSLLSEYMLHSNFEQTLTRVIGRNFGANTFILPLSLFPEYLSISLDVLSTERKLKHK